MENKLKIGLAVKDYLCMMSGYIPVCLWIILGLPVFLKKRQVPENGNFTSRFNRPFVLEDGTNLYFNYNLA